MRAVLARMLALDGQRGMLFCWTPVCLALGIGGYFALPAEPSRPGWTALAVALAALLALAVRRGRQFPWLVGLALVMAGFSLAGLRSHSVAEPMLGFRYYGPIEGRIVKVDRSRSGALRLTLDRVRLDRVTHPPARVRLSLHGDQRWLDPVPGAMVAMTGHLAPPSGPTEPGGFDFRRLAWFDRLGAVGYTRSPVLPMSVDPPDWRAVWLGRQRLRIATAVRQAMPGEAGAFVAAITTGDRSGIAPATLEDLRASNLAHLLAISGLHMGLLAGFVFAAARLGLALVPGLAVARPIKAWAAAVALVAAAGYLAMSGGNVATQRAFVMVAVMLGAVIAGRRALTLRAVALAATVLLVAAPESLTEAGFQMSFAATTALVAVFRLMRQFAPQQGNKILGWVAALVISSAVAGTATAPFAAAHFHRVVYFGLIANMLTVPLMGALVMPLAVLSACLAPFGLAGLGLALMQPAVEWILGVAHWVATLPGGLGHVPAAAHWALPLLSLGAIWVILWQGLFRWGGLAVVAVALLGWASPDRPALLVSESGGLLGLATPQGRALSKPRGDGFAAETWLEADGDAADQAAAAARSGFTHDGMEIVTEVGGLTVAHLRGKAAADKVGAACARADLVIVLADALPAQGDCRVIDRGALRRLGALAISPDADGAGLRVIGARQVAGRRPWAQ